MLLRAILNHIWELCFIVRLFLQAQWRCQDFPTVLSNLLCPYDRMPQLHGKSAGANQIDEYNEIIDYKASVRNMGDHYIKSFKHLYLPEGVMLKIDEIKIKLSPSK